MRLLRCPKCYEEITESSRQCKFCNVHLTMAEDQRCFLFAKITCPRCKYLNMVTHKYCSMCALPLTKKCSHCEVETLYDARVCGNCKNFFGDLSHKKRKRKTNAAVSSNTSNMELENINVTGNTVAMFSRSAGDNAEEAASRRILIVDDEPFIGKLVKTLLELEGYGVEVAYNVAMARQIVKEQPPSLVITDIMMPDEDGYTFLKELKSSSDTRPIQVIMLSVMSEFEDVKKSIVGGAIDHIAKPFDPTELIWAVKKALGGYASWEKRDDLISVQ